MTIEGRVVHKSSRNIRVETSGGVLLCSLRGKFRGDSRGTAASRSPVVVGDRVVVTATAEGEGVLEEIKPRINEIRRVRALVGRDGQVRRRTGRTGTGISREVIVAANVDQVLLVMAALSPPPRWTLVDRVLISAAWEQVHVGVCVNKIDQIIDERELVEDLADWLDLYESLGLSTFAVSALENDGVDDLRGWLKGKLTVLSGHSGVGKSTLINALDPKLQVATGAVNVYTGKGRQTTTAVSLYALAGETYLVDTPGYREYGLLNLERSEIGRYYDEFRPHLGSCRFKDCCHVDEPDCAVRAAVEAGTIDERRYDNYLQILESP